MNEPNTKENQNMTVYSNERLSLIETLNQSLGNLALADIRRCCKNPELHLYDLMRISGIDNSLGIKILDSLRENGIIINNGIVSYNYFIRSTLGFPNELKCFEHEVLKMLAFKTEFSPPKMGGFILGCCFIDSMSGFYLGVTTKSFQSINTDFAVKKRKISKEASMEIHVWLKDNGIINSSNKLTKKPNIDMFSDFPSKYTEFCQFIVEKLCEYYAGVSSGDAFRMFVERYLNQYSPGNLYDALRCKLVHAYTEGGVYRFTDNNKDGAHLSKKDNKIILNLEDFVNDLESAFHRFIQDLKTDDKIYENALKRFKSMSILGIH